MNHAVLFSCLSYLIVRLVDEKEKELDAKYELEVTVGEVYMERVRDLLISEVCMYVCV